MRTHFLLFFFFFTTSSLAKSNVTFVNVPENVKAEILSKFPELENGGDLSYPLLDDVVRALSAKEEFDSVSVKSNGGNEILFEVRPRNLVGSIELEGTDAFSDEHVRNLIGIKEKDRFNRNLAVQGASKLKAFYGENGYFNAIVDVEFKQLPESQMRIIYTVKENLPCRIQNVFIESSNSALNERLALRVKSFRKKNLNQTHIDQIIERMKDSLIDWGYLTASFDDSKLIYNEDKTQATIQFSLTDPYRWDFYLSGNAKKSKSELYKVLDLSNPDRRNLDPLNEAVDRLRRYYLSDGYSHVQIKADLQVLNEQPIKKAYLEIAEGPRVRIEKMEIEGRFSRPPSYYSDFIEDHSSKLLSQGYYNRQDLDLGLDNMVNYLKNQGYLKARIQSTRTDFSDDKSMAHVVVNLDEGALTQVQAVSFEGNSFFSERELISVFGLQASAPLKLSDLESGISKLKAFYLKQGFLEMKILNEDKTLVQYNDKGTLAEIRFRVYEGPRVRVSEIVVEGNTFTKKYVILKESGIKLGQVLNPQIIEESMDRLNRLGIFSRVDFRTLEENTAIGDRTLIIQVTERDPGLFRMGAGANNERELTARGFIGLGYNNILGTARAVSGRAELNYNIAQINYPETEYSLGYFEPFLFGSRTRGRVNLTKSERVFEYRPKDDGITSITQSERVELFAEREFSKYFRGSWKAWSLDRRKDSEIKGRCIESTEDGKPPDYTKKCDSSVQQVAKIGPILDLDYRDNPFLPSKGSFSRLQMEYSNPILGSSTNIHFYKADAQHSRYLRIGSSRVIWANTLRGGYLRNLSQSVNSGVPASQAFFLGGVFTIRGFDASSDAERIPPNYELRVDKSTALIIKKDSYYGLFKSELRFPISGEFGGALFYDGGMVQVTKVDIHRPYRDSVGFGLRYNTPVGAVSLDLAFKINPELSEPNREEEYRVHFSIGSF